MLPLEAAIVEKLQNDGPCCLDDVVTHLSSFSWGEIFMAVDRMSRDGRLLLHQRRYSTYQIALCPIRFSTSQKAIQSSLMRYTAMRGHEGECEDEG